MKTERKKNQFLIALFAGMINLAAFYFSVSADLPHVFFICFAGTVVTLFLKRPVKYTDRGIIYGILLAGTLTILLNLVFPMDENRFGYIGEMGKYVVPFLLYLAVLVTFFDTTPTVLGICISFSVTSLFFAGDTYPGAADLERLSFFQALADRGYVFMLMTTILEFVMFILALQILRPGETDNSPLRAPLKTVLILAITVTAALSGLGIYHLFEKYENVIRRLQHMMIRRSTFRHYSGRIVFGDDIDLNRTINPRLEKNRDKLVLRCWSKYPPGYLRGRAYINYSNGKWSIGDLINKRFQAGAAGLIVSYRKFYFPGSEDRLPPVTYNIYPSRTLLSDVLLYPAEATHLELVADKLNYGDNGIVIPDDWKRDGGYSAHCGTQSQAQAYPRPGTFDKNEYTSVPENLKREMDSVVRDALASSGTATPVSEKELVEILLEYLRRYYRYEIVEENNNRSVPGPGEETRTDPVVHFLKERKAGHCEFFASALVLMLRSRGIPARYVTGFVCMETHPSGDYHVSRIGDAHAWVEAYDSEKEEWVLLEPTPPSGVPNFRHDWSLAESWKDRISAFFQSLFADMRRGYFAKAVVDIFKSTFSLLLYLVWHPIRGPGFIIVLFLINLYRLLRSGNGRYRGDISPARQELCGIFSKIEKAVREKTRIQREHGMTVSEWKENAAHSAFFSYRSELRGSFNTLLKEYEDLRYRQPDPSPKEIKSFRNKYSKIAVLLRKRS